MAGLADYLSKNYGSGKKSKKSSKLKSKTSSTVIIDEGSGLSSIQLNTKNKSISANKTAVNPLSGSFVLSEVQQAVETLAPKKLKGGWKEVGSNAPAKQVKVREEADNNTKKVRRNVAQIPGLQIFNSADESESEQEAEADKPPTAQQQTIYRNAQGQIIDAAEQAERDEQAKKDFEIKKRKLEAEKNLSEVLALKRQKYQEDIDKLKDVKTTVHANDVLLNREKKAQVFEEDPLLAISSTLGGDAIKIKSNVPSSKFGRKLYNKGPPPVNRFNIAPGYRWDGVDRSNGFELKWFDKQYEVQERKALKQSLHDFDE